jgi:hypothetical protein
VDTARSLLQKIESGFTGNGLRATTILDKTFAVRPPIQISEYESLVENAVESCRGLGNCRFVLMGPGRFNEDTVEDYAIHGPELWAEVNDMVLRLARRLGVAVMNAQEALGQHDGTVFLTNNHRWSEFGHEVVARELASVIASEITTLIISSPEVVVNIGTR